MKLKDAPQDTSRVILYNTIATDYRNVANTEESLAHADEAYKLSMSLGYLKGAAEASRIKGLIYQGGIVDSSLFYYFQALRIYKEIDHRPGMVQAYYDIANVNLQLRNLEKVKEYQEASYELAKSLGDPKYLSIANNGMGLYYISSGRARAQENDSTASLENYKRAIPYFTKAAEEAEKVGYKFGTSVAYGNLAYAMTAIGNYEKALVYAFDTLREYEKRGLETFFPISFHQISDIYLKQRRYDKALEYAFKILELDLVDGENYYKLQAYELLCRIYQGMGDYKKALEYSDLRHELYKIVSKGEKQREITTIQAQYDTEMLKSENLLLKQQTELDEANLVRQRILIWAVIGALLVITIISLLTYWNLRAKKRFASQVEALQAAQSRWFTNIAHELRTPLTLIVGPIKSILSQPNDTKQVEQQASMAQRNGEQLLQRVNEILDVSRMDSGRLALHQVPTNVSVLIAQVITSFGSLVEQKDISLTSSCDGMVFMEVDREKLRNILNNLVANALKFTHVGGAVRVVLEQTQDAVEIRVSDTGIGIPQGDLPHIFDRFYQVSRSKEVDHGGSGVGLALSRELARMHGGELTVASEESKGSTFTLSLPAALVCEMEETPRLSKEKVEEPPKAEAKVVTPIKKGDGPKVLLVEDHPDMRHYIRKLLEGHYQVIEAIDGVDALEQLQEVTPDLIVSDVMMPRMDGITLARELKKDTSHILIPFITLTAHANERDKLAALRTGVDDYLVKPFDPEELLVRAKNLIDNAKVRQQMLEEGLGVLEKEVVPTHEELWVKRLEEAVRNAMEDANYSVNDLATYAATSERNLRRNLRRATGLSPLQFIREIRLQQALLLLETHQHATVVEITHAVGFEDASSFSRLFRQRFGKSPSSFFQTASS